MSLHENIEACGWLGQILEALYDSTLCLEPEEPELVDIIESIMRERGEPIPDRNALPDSIVKELGSLGELGRKVRDYCISYQYDTFAHYMILDVIEVNRSELLRLDEKHSLPEDISKSINECRRYLSEVAEKFGKIG